MSQFARRRWRIGALAVGGLLFFGAYEAFASDHLDTPTVIKDPSADIADVFAWTSADGRRLKPNQEAVIRLSQNYSPMIACG